ncbi:phosphoethanolamine transferase [Sedimenticola sp.]|uniref:phosphoethanolamine transferase n=1 Tax=Sedimenticola sp. TaxID=1940285 RepID=UPI003D0EF5F9
MLKTVKFSSVLVTFMVSLYLLMAFNTAFFSTVFRLFDDSSIDGVLFVGSLVLFLLAIFNGFLSLFAFRYVLKPALVLIILSASCAAYFINAYGIMIDKTMIQNLMESDLRESAELLSPKLFLYLVFLGVVPSAMVILLPVRYRSWSRELVYKVGVLLVSAVVVGCIAALFFQSYASLFRSNRFIRDLIVPVNYLYSTSAYIRQLIPAKSVDFSRLGEDAVLGDAWYSGTGAEPQRKVVTLLIVGETARAQNFSLNGYVRETNPNLKREDVISFANFHSCGTTTAVSVPCMFSRVPRTDYDSARERHTENLLDVLKHAGINVVWRDNNSGCKSVCRRVEFEDLSAANVSGVCRQDECYDMVLLERLKQKINVADGNLLVVLHQKGSHGPAYYLRTPKAFQRFQPACHYVQLQKCSQAEIRNAYDNTILYTDYFLSQAIGVLESYGKGADTAMVYLSDHGESLGENNLYLHGLPYLIAPQEQTHVPFLLWMSDGFADRFSISESCLKNAASERFSQDNLFDSMLGLLNIETDIYRPQLDMFHPCTGAGRHRALLAEGKT